MFKRLSRSDPWFSGAIWHVVNESSQEVLLANIGPAKDKHGVRESFAKVTFLFAKNGRSRIEEFWSTAMYIYIYMYILHMRLHIFICISVVPLRTCHLPLSGPLPTSACWAAPFVTAEHSDEPKKPWALTAGAPRHLFTSLSWHTYAPS